MRIGKIKSPEVPATVVLVVVGLTFTAGLNAQSNAQRNKLRGLKTGTPTVLNIGFDLNDQGAKSGIDLQRLRTKFELKARNSRLQPSVCMTPECSKSWDFTKGFVLVQIDTHDSEVTIRLHYTREVSTASGPAVGITWTTEPMVMGRRGMLGDMNALVEGMFDTATDDFLNDYLAANR